jgi:hypothetical protein
VSDWTPDSLAWDRFEPESLDSDLTDVIGGLALVESRSALYGNYLLRVLQSRFAAQPHWPERISNWQAEEHQHGDALQRWMRLARGDRAVDEALARYLRDVSYHQGDESVRGTVENELVCRCTIEALATTLYRALAARAREPVLVAILRHLAADEARHFRMFFDLLEEERALHGQHLFSSATSMFRRLRALDDEQIMYAYHCASESGSFSSRRARARFLPRIYSSYSVEHLRALSALLARVLKISNVRAINLLSEAGGRFLRARGRFLSATDALLAS